MGAEKRKLDQFDQALVALLRQDGRMSFTDIAQQLDVSVSTVRNRYNRLVEDKVLHILGWVDPTKSDYLAYNRVTIEVRPSSKISSVISSLVEIEEVSFLAATSGASDIEINLVCHDNEHLLKVINEKVHTIDGVYKTESTVYYTVHKWASQQLKAVQAIASPNKKS